MDEDRPGDTKSTANIPVEKTLGARVPTAVSQAEHPQQEVPNDPGEQQWQNRLLPWMIRMIVGLTAFFFIASLVQLFYLHWEISTAPVLNPNFYEAMMDGLLHSAEKTSTASLPATSGDQQLTAAMVGILSSLETNAVARRYHQANVSLMSRVWTRYLGFVTGMVLAMVGAIFILGKLQVPESQAVLRSGTLAMQLRTTSPGLILAGLGTVLMVITIVTHHEINVQDRPLYLQGMQLTGASVDRATDNSKAHAPVLKVREGEGEKSDEATKEGVAAPPFLKELQNSMQKPQTTDQAAGITR